VIAPSAVSVALNVFEQRCLHARKQKSQPRTFA
jgi:hypothetical protein